MNKMKRKLTIRNKIDLEREIEKIDKSIKFIDEWLDELLLDLKYLRNKRKEKIEILSDLEIE